MDMIQQQNSPTDTAPPGAYRSSACYPASWFIALFLHSTPPRISRQAIAVFTLHMPVCAQCKKYGKFAPFIPSCFVYT